MCAKPGLIKTEVTYGQREEGEESVVDIYASADDRGSDPGTQQHAARNTPRKQDGGTNKMLQ